MKTFSRFIALSAASLLAVAVLVSGPAAMAATITWGSATNITDGSDVSTVGTLEAAFAFQNDVTRTVNGVDFRVFGDRATGNVTISGTYAGTNKTLTYVGTNNALSGYLLVNEGTAPFTNITPSAYQEMLKDGLAQGQDPGEAPRSPFTFGNLTVGTTYIVQFWANANYSSRATSNLSVLSTGSTGANSVSIDPNTTNTENGGVGQFVTGSFTADATTQTIYWGSNQGNGGPYNVVLNAAQLRAVPEPGTLALAGMGLGGAALAFARRRKKTAA